MDNNREKFNFTEIEAKARSGDIDARRCLGFMYLGGYNVKQDTEKGIEWLKKVSDSRALMSLSAHERYLYGLEK